MQRAANQRKEGGRRSAAWWREWDSNPRWPEDHTSFQDWPYKPLRHPSAKVTSPGSRVASHLTRHRSFGLGASGQSQTRDLKALLQQQTSHHGLRVASHLTRHRSFGLGAPNQLQAKDLKALLKQYLSNVCGGRGPDFGRWTQDFGLFCSRRDRKKSFRIAPQRSARTPLTTGIRWLSRVSETTSNTLPHAPAMGSAAP
jgi:hypothetical protein